MKSQSVIVVGGSRGIGLGIARAAGARGANVTIVSRNRADVGFPSLAADATREEDVIRVFQDTGPIDHVVMTAADLRYEAIRDLTVETVKAVIDSKVLAAVLLAKHAPLRAGGSLTFVTGMASERPAPKGALTATVNGAVNALVRALALELAPLRVNAISPGWVDTPLWDRIASELVGQPKEAIFANAASRLPARRVGTIDDIGHAAVFLMENGFTTGEILYVDGGQRLV